MIRCAAKRSLLLNFFLIDFSRANLGMHWHCIGPPRSPDAHVRRQEDRLPCGSCSFVSSPLFQNCLSTEIYVHFPLFSFQFFSSLFFVISFENVRLVIQQIPSLSFLQCLLFPFLLLLDTYIHASHLSCSMSFHSPLGTFPLPPCLIICFLNAIFYVAPFWFVSPCRVVFTCRISLVRVCFLLHVIPVFWYFFSVSVFVFSQFDVASFTFNSFKLSRLFSLLLNYLRRWWWVFQTKINEYSSRSPNVTWVAFIIIN